MKPSLLIIGLASLLMANAHASSKSCFETISEEIGREDHNLKESYEIAKHGVLAPELLKPAVASFVAPFLYSETKKRNLEYKQSLKNSQLLLESINQSIYLTKIEDDKVQAFLNEIKFKISTKKNEISDESIIFKINELANDGSLCENTSDLSPNGLLKSFVEKADVNH